MSRIRVLVDIELPLDDDLVRQSSTWSLFDVL